MDQKFFTDIQTAQNLSTPEGIKAAINIFEGRKSGIEKSIDEWLVTGKIYEEATRRLLACYSAIELLKSKLV